MNILIALACGLTIANAVLTCVIYHVLKQRLIFLQDDMNAMRVQLFPPNVGGRLAPTPSELQAARNRMDRLGVAHPGGPS